MLHGRVEPGLSTPRRRLQLIDAVDRWSPLSVAWCGVFVAHCLEATLDGIEKPFAHHRARPWLDWGEPAEPQLGALLIFWHLHPKSPFGHVGFYWAEDAENYHVLGGNQRDTIEIQRYPKTRLIGCRWPPGVPQVGERREAPKEAAASFQYAKTLAF
jgi:uncharacterized protein (TIGR02594 family)